MEKRLLIFWIVACAFIFERIISATSLFERLELKTYDFRSKISIDHGLFNKRFKHADKNIVIVTVDDYSRKEIAKNSQLELGSFPWRRDVWAGVVDFIEEGEPKAILFDIPFNELNENSWNDRRFAQELRRYDNIVLSTSLNNPKYWVDRLPQDSEIENSDYLPTSRPLNVKINSKKIDKAITYYSHAPVHDLYTKDNTVGVANQPEDVDSVIRNSQPVFKLIKNDEIYYMPSLAFAGFLKYMGEDGSITIKNNKLFYKDRVIPVNKKGLTPISWHGRGQNYSFIPVSKILLSEDGYEYIDPDYFKDKIVIIGRTETGTDIHPSTVNSSYAISEINATVIDNFINDSYINGENVRKFIKKMPAWITFILTVLSCCLIAYIGIISKTALKGLRNSSIFIILYILISIWLFANPTIRLWVPIVVPVYYLVITSAIVFSFKFQKEWVKRSRIINTFGKFVSPEVLSILLKNPDSLTLGGTRKPVTILSCCIKDFTAMSEKYNPEQLIDNSNELFNEIVNVIFENNGTIDKFINGCIRAYWGAPTVDENNAFTAVKTALEIKKKANELKIENAKENKMIFDVKIGINTGKALLGLSGSEKIKNYTAIGNTVNIASYLESYCSKLDREILISKATYEAAKDKIVVLEGGRTSVEGIEKQIEIYEPIGLAEEG